jgi:nickel-type superoxide dismutase maturation protease
MIWQRLSSTAQQGLRLAKIAASWRRGHHKIFRVAGASMLPTLAPGDYVVVDTRDAQNVELEAIVVAIEPGQKTIVIKRVRSRGDSAFYLGSDNPNEGRDSRHFGSVSADNLIGAVVFHAKVGRFV